MSQVTVGLPRQTTDRGQPVVMATIEAEGQRHEIFFRASQGPLSERADPFVPVALFPAMRLGVPLRIEGQVSPRLLANVARIQEILSTWYPALKTVPVEATPAPRAEVAAGRGVGCFFTAGIDSFYSALKHQDEIASLIFVHGFDILLHRTALREKVARGVRQAAAELGKPLVEVETNLRDLIDQYAYWNKDSHGASLASVALLFPRQLDRLYIGATFDDGFFPPHGSHPLLDPLWGTDELELVHDGTDANRWQKLGSMVDNVTVQRHLHSCWEYRGEAYNCGQCIGCLESMALLRLYGASARFPTYPPLDLDKLRSWRFDDEGPNYFPILLLEAVTQKGTDPELEAALRTALETASLAKAWLGTADDLKLYIVSLYSKYSERGFHLRRAEQRSARLEAQFQRVATSRSWRITAPLRAAVNVIQRLETRKAEQPGALAKGVGQ